MAQIFKNNTTGTLAAQLNAGATACTLNAGHTFTDPGSDWYLATLIGVTGTTETSWEIVRVTDVSTNTLTITRAQESTSDATWPAGTRIEARLTAGATESKANLGAAAYKAVGTGSGDVAAGDHAHASLYQPLDSDLTAVAGLSTTGLIERTGSGTAGIVTITTAGKAILDDADAATQRATLGLGTANSPQFTAIELGHATDTTIARSAAGQVTIEGVQVATASNSMTLSNKTLAAGTVVARGGAGEGGEIRLQVPESSTSLAADIAIDVAGDDFRVFENGGTGRGARFPIDDCSASAGSNFVIDNLTQTLTNKTLTDPIIVGAVKEAVYTITDGTAFEIDPSNGTIQTITLGANRTPKGTNFAAGESVTLMIDDGSECTLTWTDSTFGTGGVAWIGGTVPTLLTSGYTVVVLWKVASQVYGMWKGA